MKRKYIIAHLLVITIVSIPVAKDPIKEFFDDFTYHSASDSLIVQRGWTIVNGRTGPPEGAFYSREQILFEDDPRNSENVIMYCMASISEDYGDMLFSRVETDTIFHEGTYAARIFFDNRLRKTRIGNIQAFYTINDLRYPFDSLYSECDMEYRRYDTWDPNGNVKSKLYLTTWATYSEDPWYGDFAADTIVYSFSGWHVLLFQVMEGRVKYFIDRQEAPLAEHRYSLLGSEVYPPSSMKISFINRITEKDNSVHDKNLPAHQSKMGVDWVYFMQDTCLTPKMVVRRIRDLRKAGISFLSTAVP